MKMMHIGTCLSSIAITLLVIGLPGAVEARGNGIKAGSGRLHFGIDLELTYDSNPGYAPINPYFDLMLRTRPSITLEFPSESVSFDLEGTVGYDYYCGLDNPLSTDMSTVTGEADMKFGINPNGQFSFFLTDNFSRTGDPRYSVSNGRLDRTDNEVKAQFQIKPGGGALMFDLGYGFFIDWFDQARGLGYNSKSLSNYGHRVYFSGKWKFLPKTALLVDFDADLRRFPYKYEIFEPGGAARQVNSPDVNAIRATVGLIGQISPSISVVIKAGYGDSLLGDAKMSDEEGTPYTGEDYRSAIGQAEVTYKSGTTFLQAGYSRNFQPVMLFGYFSQDRLYARFSQQIMGRFTILLNIGLDLLDYGQPVVTSSSTSSTRSDNFLSGGASFDYHILEWLDLTLDYRLQALFTEYIQPHDPIGAGTDYYKHTFTFRVGVDY